MLPAPVYRITNCVLLIACYLLLITGPGKFGKFGKHGGWKPFTPNLFSKVSLDLISNRVHLTGIHLTFIYPEGKITQRTKSNKQYIGKGAGDSIR